MQPERWPTASGYILPHLLSLSERDKTLKNRAMMAYKRPSTIGQKQAPCWIKEQTKGTPRPCKCCGLCGCSGKHNKSMVPHLSHIMSNDKQWNFPADTNLDMYKQWCVCSDLCSFVLKKTLGTWYGPVWTRFSLIPGTRWSFSLVLVTRFLILGTRNGSLTHLEKLTLCDMSCTAVARGGDLWPYGGHFAWVFTSLATSPKLWRFTSCGDCRLPQAIRTLQQIGSWS